MISISLYIVADTFFVSKGIGLNGLTSLNLALPIFSFVSAASIMISTGGATMFSIVKAGGDEEKANNIFTVTTLFGIAVSLILVVVGLFFSRQLAIILGAEGAIIADTAVYIKYTLIFAPAFVLSKILIFFIRNIGRPTLSMVSMIVGSLANIVLDYIFIFPCQMGMFGVIIATCLAPVISIIIVIPSLLKDRASLHFVKPKNVFYLCKKTTRLGVPFFVTELSWGLVMLVFNYIILKISGNLGVAAYGIIANMAFVAISIFSGIAQGSQPLLSQNYGKNKPENVKKLMKYSLLSALVVGIVMYALMSSLSSGLISIFNADNVEEFKTIASQGVLIYFAALPFMGINIVLAMYFTSTNNPRQAFIISILRGLVLIMLSVLILSRLFGLTGVWLSVPITELLTMIISLFLINKTSKKQSIL